MNRAFFAELSRVARASIEVALREGLSFDNKLATGFDPVTEADRAAERAMRAAIERQYPSHGVWGEEFGMDRPDAPYRWSLDPVDGTRALICGLPSWAVLVGLLHNGVHVAGMIDLPAIDECLVAVDGMTLLGDLPARASQCTSLAEARLSTTDPNLFGADEFERFERVRQSARLTRFGLDAMAYARVATGDLDLVIENGLKPHDYDALVAVVRGAGGVIGDWSGGQDFGPGCVVAAATPELYNQAIGLLTR